jgi:hypothetical protein
VKPQLLEVFRQTYRKLRPRAPMPELTVEFYPYAGVNHTIRMREGRLLVRLSDLIEGAPESILDAIAHILLAKIYRAGGSRAQHALPALRREPQCCSEGAASPADARAQAHGHPARARLRFGSDF